LSNIPSWKLHIKQFKFFLIKKFDHNLISLLIFDDFADTILVKNILDLLFSSGADVFAVLDGDETVCIYSKLF